MLSPGGLTPWLAGHAKRITVIFGRSARPGPDTQKR